MPASAHHHSASSQSRTRLFIIMLLLFIILHASVVGTVRLYPFLDTPNHLAIATIYRHYGEPTNQFVRYYVVDTFLKPNVFHLFFCGSKLFPSVEFANKVFYCLYVLLFPLSTLTVIKKIGGNQWFSLLAFLFLYNINVLYGFNGFIIAIPLVLFTFCAFLYYSESRAILAGCVLSALLVLIFFMHVLTAIFALFLFGTVSILSGKRSCAHVARNMLPSIPLVILIAGWWIRDSATYQGVSIADFLFKYYAGEYFKDYFLRGGFLIFDNFRLREGISGYALSLLFSLFVIGLVAAGFVSFRFNIKRVSPEKNFKPILAFMMCSFATFFLMPDRLPGYSFLFERFSVFIFIALILVGSVFFSHGLKTAVTGAICVLCFTHFLLWAEYFHDFDKQNEMFNKEFFFSVPNDRKLAGLMFDYRFRGRSVYDNFTDYFIVWKQGIATTRVIDERSFPVKRRVGTNVLPPYIEWAGKYDSYAGQYAEMDYILVRGELSHKAREQMQNFFIIKQTDMWVLYERR